MTQVLRLCIDTKFTPYVPGFDFNYLMDKKTENPLSGNNQKFPNFAAQFRPEYALYFI